MKLYYHGFNTSICEIADGMKVKADHVLIVFVYGFAEMFNTG